MSGRKATAVAAVLILSAFVAPASSETGANVRGASADGTTFKGECAYLGTPTTGGQIQFEFGGSAQSASSAAGSAQPISISVRCTLVSPQRFPFEPPTLTMTAEVLMSGPVAVLPPKVTTAWPFRPVYVCVSGSAEFGPIPLYTVLSRHCSNDPIPIIPISRGSNAAGVDTQFAGWIACVNNGDGTVCV